MVNINVSLGKQFPLNSLPAPIGILALSFSTFHWPPAKRLPRKHKPFPLWYSDYFFTMCPRKVFPPTKGLGWGHQHCSLIASFSLLHLPPFHLPLPPKYPEAKLTSAYNKENVLNQWFKGRTGEQQRWRWVSRGTGSLNGHCQDPLSISLPPPLCPFASLSCCGTAAPMATAAAGLYGHRETIMRERLVYVLSDSKL